MSKTILLLISDQLMCSVVHEVLERAGYVVLPTGDLGSAVDRLTECQADLLIVRSYVSSMPGHEAAEYLHARCRQMRVLILGGILDDDRIKNRTELAGFDVFPKPYPAAELLEKIKDMMNTPVGTPTHL
jgi:DNA-binding NtrC family response regulator